MPRMRSWPLSGLAVVTSMLAIAGCNRADNSSQPKPGSSGGVGSIASSEAAGQDPCTLVSASEAAPYVGPLIMPPYRATDDDDKPAVDGNACVYRGTNARSFFIRPDWTGGRMMNKVSNIPNAVGTALAKGAPGMDTLGNRIAQHGEPGPWDQATFMPGGTLFVTKGDTLLTVDVSGASGQKSDAIAIATIAMGRVGHPLGYDGGKAVSMMPAPKAHPANACDLVPRPEVEAAIGPLSAAPLPDSTGEECTYQVATAEGSRTYPVAFTWSNGGHAYNIQKHMMATVGSVLGLPTSSPMDTMKPTGNMGAMMGAMMKMVGSAGQPHSNAPSPLDTMKPTAANMKKAMAMASTPTTAPGAATTVGFTTDTTLQGPWDNASLLHGTQLLAVRNDVLVAMTLETADYAKAKALLATICTHL